MHRFRSARNAPRSLRSVAAAVSASALLLALALPAAAADTTAPTVGTPVLSATSVVPGKGVTVTATATDPGGVISTEMRIDLGAWIRMAPGNEATVSTTRSASALINAPVAAVAAGNHTCALLADHTVRCWGYNFWGGLGSPTPTAISSTPVEVPAITTVIAVTAGTDHACALLADTTVRCWGWKQGARHDNSTAHHGDRHHNGSPRSAPAAAARAPSSPTARSAAGTGPAATRSPSPASRPPSRLPGGSAPSSPTARSAAGTRPAAHPGSGHHDRHCDRRRRRPQLRPARRTTVRCWGGNEAGQLGNGTTTDSSTPVASPASRRHRVRCRRILLVRPARRPHRPLLGRQRGGPARQRHDGRQSHPGRRHRHHDRDRDQLRAQGYSCAMLADRPSAAGAPTKPASSATARPPRATRLRSP